MRVNDRSPSPPAQSHPKITRVGPDTPASPSWAHRTLSKHTFKNSPSPCSEDAQLLAEGPRVSVTHGRAGTRTVPATLPLPQQHPQPGLQQGRERSPHYNTSHGSFGARRPSPLAFLLTRYRCPSPLSVTPPEELTPR